MQPTNLPASDSLADVLELCRLRLARGETIASCLAAYPAYRAELAELLPLALQVQQLAHDPHPAYAAGARRRFQASLAAARENRSREVAAAYRGPFGWLKRFAAPLAVVAVLMLTGIGLVQASDSSLPDSPLYNVKAATESVGGLLPQTPAAKAEYQIRLANQRRKELATAESQNKGPKIRLALAKAMVYATDAATDQVVLTSNPRHDQLLGQMQLLIPAELKVLYPIANTQEVAVAQAGQGYEQQLLADQVRLGLK
jgi:hypothetical protein